MNRLTTLIALALCLALSAGVAQAKAKGAPATPKDDAKKEKENTVVGTVLKVDGTNITIKTRGKNAGEVVIATDAKTEFQFNGKTATIEKIKPGQELVVTPAATATAPAEKISATDDTKKKPKKKKDA